MVVVVGEACFRDPARLLSRSELLLEWYLEMAPEEAVRTGGGEDGAMSRFVCDFRSSSKEAFASLSFKNDPLTLTSSLLRSLNSKPCDLRIFRTRVASGN